MLHIEIVVKGKCSDMPITQISMPEINIFTGENAYLVPSFKPPVVVGFTLLYLPLLSHTSVVSIAKVKVKPPYYLRSWKPFFQKMCSEICDYISLVTHGHLFQKFNSSEVFIINAIRLTSPCSSSIGSWRMFKFTRLRLIGKNPIWNRSERINS